MLAIDNRTKSFNLVSHRHMPCRYIRRYNFNPHSVWMWHVPSMPDILIKICFSPQPPYYTTSQQLVVFFSKWFSDPFSSLAVSLSNPRKYIIHCYDFCYIFSLSNGGLSYQAYNNPWWLHKRTNAKYHPCAKTKIRYKHWYTAQPNVCECVSKCLRMQCIYGTGACECACRAAWWKL